ncbi:HlyD family secretion protein [Bradyrhizobium sp. Arg314]
MLEILLCSVVTILPDFLYRRYVQGKKIGREITLFSIWYELRWGITSCLVLTIITITMIFYFHPLTTNVSLLFRTVTILPESNGRVAEVYVKLNDQVGAGAPLFRLDGTAQQATLEAARRKVAEADAAMAVAKSQLATADGQIQQAQSTYQQAVDALDTKVELQRRNSGTVGEREIQRLRNAVDGTQGAMAAAVATKETLQEQISSLLPAQKATAEAAVQQAQVELDKTTVRAGIAGTVMQFALRTGDIVNPLRPAGILIPTGAGRAAVVAGFSQLAAQVIKIGMVGEVTCASKPFTIIPVVVTQIQDAIAGGQFRPTDQLIDVAQAQPGTLTVFMEPLYAGELADVPPGSSCVAVAYTNNEDRLETEDLNPGMWVFLHAVDAFAVLKGALLRIQALMLPVTTLVLSGH